MESGGDERVFIGQMAGLADRVGSDVIPDVALDERSHRQTPISYSFVFAKENGRSAQDGDMRFRGNQERVRSRLCSADPRGKYPVNASFC